MITSLRALLHVALLVFAGLCLPNFAAWAVTDQDPPTALIVSEDFVPLRNRWEPASGHWRINPGAGTYNSIAAGSNDIATIAEYRGIDPTAPPTPTVRFDQYSFSVRLRNQGTAAEHLVGVVFNYQGPAAYQEVVISAAGFVSLRRCCSINGATTVSSSGGSFPRDSWVDLEVRSEHGATTVIVNGQTWDHISAGIPWPSGRVGLVTHGAVGQFDKVQLTTPFGDQPFMHDFGFDAPGWTPLSGEWNVSNGTYNDAAVEQTNVTLAPINAGIAPGQTTEYTLHARMRNPYGGSGNLVGIVFNHTGSGYTEVVFSPTGVAKMNLVSNGAVQTLATAAYNGRRNISFDVTLDSTASVWVDGKQIFDNVPAAHPDLVPSGGVGLITHWAPGRFDDVWFDHGVFVPCFETFSNSTVPEVASGTWNVNGGALNGTSVNATSIALPCRVSGNLTGADAGTDFVYSARLRNEYGSSGNLVGLIFNYQDPGRSLFAGDYHELVFSPTGSAFLNKFIQGVRYRVGVFPHNVPRNTWFDVQLFRSGIYTTFKVNGVTIASDVRQGELRGGRVGVITHWAKASFDGLSVQPYTARTARPFAYTLTHIATPPPDDPATGQFLVLDLNDNGEVSGSRVGADGLQQAFIWSNGTFRNLNPLLPAGLPGARAIAVNNQSDVLGAYEDAQLQSHPYLLSSSGQPIPLTGMPAGDSVAALDLNDQREILFTVFERNAARTFVWRGGQLTPLQDLPGSSRMTAVAINNRSVVLGHGQTPTLQFTPVLWQDGAVMPLTFPDGSHSALAVALNDGGNVAATAFFPDLLPSRAQTYLWHDGYASLFDPPDPLLTSSQPRDISDEGFLVGESYNSNVHVPTVWFGPLGQDLNSMVSRQDPRQPFVRLNGAVLINNHHQIVAHGVDSRQPQGLRSWYLLTPVAQQ